MNGGSAGSDPIRFGGFQNWKGLTPELSTNWGIGFDYAPSGILKGLDVQATYYIIKLTNLLTGFGNPTANSFNDPQLGSFAFIVATDYFTSGLPGAAGCTNNLLPTTCAPFEAAVSGLIQNPRAALDPQAQTLILWINDGGTFNKGWRKLDGIDWNASYDWDWGSVGALNIGVTGTYYLHDTREVVPGSPGSVIQDAFHTTLNQGQINEQQGVSGIPLLRYRARLGWSNGPWSVTGFMDYVSHYFHTQSPPPDVGGYAITYDANGNPTATASNNFCASNGGLDAGGAGGTYACSIQGYSNIEPSWYTFDLSFGYNTMDTPSNEYLRNIGLQVVINNIMDRRSPFEYRISTGGGNPVAMDLLKNNQGRVISFILTKQW